MRTAIIREDDRIFYVIYKQNERPVGAGAFASSMLLAEAIETWLIDGEIVGEML